MYTIIEVPGTVSKGVFVNNALKKVAQIARLLAKDEQPALLSTIGLNGSPRSRYMGAFRIRDTGDFFLISPSNTNKMEEIQRNPQVQVIFSDKGFKRVLTLSGKAGIVKDTALRQELFEEKKPLKLYPVFNDHFGVVHFMPLQAEYLDLNVSNDPVVIDLPGDRPIGAR